MPAVAVLSMVSLTNIVGILLKYYIYIYTGCPRRNVPDFGRVFLMLKYTDITQNTYVQSWTAMEIMAREKCGLLAGPRTVPLSWHSYQCLSLSVVSYDIVYSYVVRLYQNAQSAVLRHCRAFICAWNPKDNYDMSASVFVVQLNGFMSLTS
jgi:hypothetical protein